MEMGGAEKLLVESISFFQDQKIKVDVLVLQKNNTLPLWKDLVDKCRGRVWALTTKSIYNPFLILDLVKVFRSYSYIHVHLFPALYWSVLAKVLAGIDVKLYYTEHSTHNKRREKWLFRLFDRFIYSYLQKIITISTDVHEKLLVHLGERFSDKLSLIPNGIDLQKFQNAEPYPRETFFKSDSIIITQVSSFRYPKDQKTILKALLLLDERIKLLLIGVGENLESCKQFCKENNLLDRVNFLGLRDDVPRLLKSSDILILSSAYEGLSLSNIEGMSAGKPFVASDVPGIRNIVNNYGLLFDYQDEVLLAEIIRCLVSDPVFYQKIAQKCLERADDFSIDRMVASYIRTYEND